jgi:glutamate-1-semialdehyde 2,1-aminomutase
MIVTRRVQALAAAEAQHYVAQHARCARHAAAAAPHYLFGVPMHWMHDWPMPSPLVVQRAAGNRLWCADGHAFTDFCLGDTGAMYGHSPDPVADAVAAQAAQGLTAMLPGEGMAAVGAGLQRLFGLPRWQLALSASDANRFVLRWARAITGRAKVLVFEGCYHGTVDDTLVDRAGDGRTLTRASLLGQVHDLAAGTVVVPFNDLDAVQAALAGGDIACVLSEPALTNCGLVPPAPGFLAGLQQAAHRHGTLFVLDETHTVSTAWGGCSRAWALEPDLLVVGKAIAGGFPVAVYGFTEAVAGRMEAAKRAAAPGHSGIGTTLSGSLIALAALNAALQAVITPEAHGVMEQLGARLQAGLERVIGSRGLPWCVTRLGARMELQFRAVPPRDAREAAAAMDDGLEAALHLYLLNHGVLVTPFHNMWLVPPCAVEADVDHAVAQFGGFLERLLD